MTKEFNVIIERDEEGYYVASVPELQGCHTQAKSLDKFMERIREAIELCLEVEKDLPKNLFIGVKSLGQG
jgi:predicted RNase H-like HicB family nuclease